MGWEVGAMHSQRQVKPFIGAENKLLCVHSSTQMATVYLLGQGSSLKPSIPLLVLSTGIIYSIVDCHQFTRSHK